ncbi:MAG: response regulator [bacterium]
MKNILVVDDDYAMRKGIALRLEGNGYNVHEAEDANEAMNQLTKTHFDLAILDLFLPGLDGIELGNIIKNRYPTVKILLLTANTTSSLAKTAHKIYKDDFIEKKSLDTILLAKTAEIFQNENKYLS